MDINLLEEHFPKNWEKNITYSPDQPHKRYALVKLAKDSDEYLEVVAKSGLFLKPPAVLKISRVQNPYAYIRYQLENEKLDEAGQLYVEEFRYEIIYPGDKDVALAYNCEGRRYTMSSATSFRSCPSFPNCRAIVVLRTKENAAYDRNRYPAFYIEQIEMKVDKSDGVNVKSDNERVMGVGDRIEKLFI